MSVSYPCAIGYLLFSRLRALPRRLRVWGAGLLMGGTLGLLLTGCPSTPTTSPTVPVPQPPESSQLARATAEERQAYARADALRTRGQFIEARLAFTDFIQRFPSSPLTDDALLALGQIATALGNDHEAQQAYATLLQRFPTSEHVPQGRLELGMSYYQTKDYDRSRMVFQQLLDPSSAPHRQALVHYYLGMMAYQEQHFMEAVGEFKLSADLDPESEAAKQAQHQLSRLVHEDLSLAELEQLARQYPTAYPGDLILMQLVQHYREAGNEADEMAVLQRFIEAFPTHPNAQVAMDRLQELQAAFTTDRTKIGVLLPLSGEGHQYGQSALRGIELALAVWQEHHPEMPLALVIRDSHSATASAGDTLHAMVSEAHVIGVIGPLFSQTASTLAPLAEILSVPLISPYAPDGSFPASSTYAFRSGLTDDFQARFLAQYAIQTLQLQRFAILYPDEPYGITLKNLFIEHVIRLQGSVMIAVPYPPDETDFTQPISLLGGIDDDTRHDLQAGAEPARSSSANGFLPPPYDAIFIPGYYDKVGLIAPALVFYNITGVQLLGTDGWNAPGIVEIGERFVEGAIFTDGFFAASPAPLVQEFVQRFEARFQEKPDLLAAQAYDTVWMIAHVLQEGAHTRRQLRDGLLRLQNFTGVTGTTTLRQDGDAEKIPYILTVRNGKIVQVPYPPL